MIWQDLVITSVSTVFSVSLIPQVIQGFKEKKGVIKLQTSAPTFIGLFVIAITFITLTLYFSAVLSFVSSGLWLILFLQRLLYKN